MKFLQKIKKIINEDIINITETSYGITNNNYIVETKQNKYFCRIPKDNTTIINKNNEKEAINILKNESYFLDIIYHDNNILITKFKPNSKTFISNKNLSNIIKIANIIKELHDKKFEVNSTFNPIEIFEQYYSQVEEFPEDIEEFLYIIDDFKKIYNPDRLCHNDLVEGNFLFHNNKIYLIDFEYAGKNDYYFDIASFISENNLTYEETITFLKSYFNDEKCNFDKLDTFLKFADLLWFTWACMLYEKRNEEIYKTIASEKYSNLKNTRKILY